MNGIAARLDYQNGVDIFRQAYAGVIRDGKQVDVVEEFLLTQSDLQLEQPVLAGTQQYNFPVMVNIQSANNNQFNTEIRLKNQDTFLPQYVGLFLAYPSSNLDTTWRPKTYPNPVIDVNFAATEGLYAGAINIMVNNRNYITNWKTSRHLVVPFTQQTAALGPASPEDQFDGADMGFYPMQPYVIISGSSNMQITVQLPAPIATVSEFQRLVLVFRGIIAYNSTITT
jgi:hypothetical protein